jgi:hypothetical protein
MTQERITPQDLPRPTDTSKQDELDALVELGKVERVLFRNLDGHTEYYLREPFIPLGKWQGVTWMFASGRMVATEGGAS